MVPAETIATLRMLADAAAKMAADERDEAVRLIGERGTAGRWSERTGVVWVRTMREWDAVVEAERSRARRPANS